MNSTGVSARFLELFKEKVERKKYELNWENPLTVNDVIEHVLGPETTRSGRGYVHMLRNIYPKEKMTDLIRRPADALALHASNTEYGVHFLEGLEDCLRGGWDEETSSDNEPGKEDEQKQLTSPEEKRGENKEEKNEESKEDEIGFICVDIFTKVHQVELPPPKKEEEENEEEIEEILEQEADDPNQHEETEHRDNPENDKEVQKSADDSENRTREGEVNSVDRKEATENQQKHSPRSERSEDDLAFYLNQTRPKTEEKSQNMAEGSAGGAREGTPLQVESGVPSKEQTPGNAQKSPVTGKDEPETETQPENLTEIEKSEQPSNDETEASIEAPRNEPDQPETKETQQDHHDSVDLSSQNVDPNVEPISEVKPPTLEVKIPVEGSDSASQEPPLDNVPSNDGIHPEKGDRSLLPEEALMIGALLAEEGEEPEEGSYFADSRPLTRTTGRSVRSAESALSVKTFSNKFQHVFVLVNWEQISSILESVEILEVIVGHCSEPETKKQQLDIPGEKDDDEEDRAFSPKQPVLQIVTLPFTREKLRSRELYTFYQTSFERILNLNMRKFYDFDENGDLEVFEAEVAKMTKCVQNKLFESLFEAVNHQRKKVEKNAAQLSAISRSRRRVPRENYPDIDVSDADWLIQLARSKWVLDFKVEAMDMHETALRIKEGLNGQLSPDNLRTLRELCDWAVERQERNRAIQLLIRMMEIQRQTVSEDNILFSALFTELGHVQDANGQLQEALDSHSQALQIETVNRGSDHPDVATCQCNIGRIHYKLFRLDLSGQFLNKALKTREFYFGPKSTKTAQVYSYLGDTWLALKDGMKALSYYEKSLIGREASLEVAADPENHLAEVLEKLGDAHSFRCDFNKALSFYGRALDSRSQQSNNAGLDLLEVRHKYAKTLHSMSAYR